MSLQSNRLPAVCWLLTLACSARAETTATNAFQAPPITVTATRVERAPESVPAQVSIITAEQLRETGARNVADALRDLGGVYVRSLYGNAAQAEVALRGFGENSHGRVLVLRDGQRLNTPDMAGINWLQIPLGSVERIEILKGGQSMLYGDHALSGVINIVTHAEAPADRTELSAQAGSYDSYAGRAAVTRADGQTSVNAGADWQTSDGYRHNSDFDAFGARAGARQRLNDNLSATAAVSYDRYDNGLAGHLTKEQMDDDPRQTTTPDDDVSTESYNANAALDWLTDADGHLTLNAIVNRREVENDLVGWSSFADTAVDSLTLTAKHALETDLLNRPDRLLTGVDFYFDDFTADRFADLARETKLLDAKIDKQSVGVYAQNELDFADRWTLSAGGRVEQARYVADVTSPAGDCIVDDAAVHNASSLAASLLYRPHDAAKLYARAASVYRLPFIDEQVSYYGFGSDRFYQDLEPETGLDYEVGGLVRLAGEWQAQAALFRMDMRNEINYNPVTGDNANMDDTCRQGAEAGLSWARQEVASAGLQYTYTDATFSDGPFDGCDVPLVPPHHVAVNASANLPAGLELLATCHFVSHQTVGGDYANQAAKLPSYSTLDLALRYTPERFASCSVLFGVDNVFDAQYANVAYVGMFDTGYYPAPGRTWKTAVACAF
ncbi:MAG: TonB-dependent receptor [Kiritimatiellae bacterium]|nr:TonB-dependent receptor [Kiritimatiellia bacterium]